MLPTFEPLPIYLDSYPMEEKLLVDTLDITESSEMEMTSEEKTANLDDPSQFTPDFRPMIRAIYWSTTGFYFLQFLIPQFAEIIGIAEIEFGVIFSALTLGNIISSPIAGYLSDRINKHYVAVTGIFGRGCAYLIMYTAMIARSYYLFVFSTFFLGLVASFFWVPFNQLIAEKSHPNQRSFAYSQRDSAVGKGGVIGGLTGFGFVTLGEYLFGTIAAAYFSLVIFAGTNFYSGYLFLKRVTHEQLEDETKIIEDARNPLHSPSSSLSQSQSKGISIFILGLVIMMAGYFVSSINSNMTQPFIQTYILRNLTPDTGLLVLMYVPAGMIPMLLASKIGQFVEQLNIFLGISLACVLGGLLTFFLVNTSNKILFSFLLTMDAAVALSEALLLDKFVSRISLSHRGKIFGSREFFINFGGVIGPLLGGWIWKLGDLRDPFLVSVGVELVMIPLFCLAIWLVRPFLAEKI
jgi:MFS family permease